ncbi:hypothetical protein HDU76_005362 [Blyttiomyces sp. JEL0837]|nr:hypothetical protein HDU76_005362 [Blyttiomyces sp. JEL0837]
MSTRKDAIDTANIDMIIDNIRANINYYDTESMARVNNAKVAFNPKEGYTPKTVAKLITQYQRKILTDKYRQRLMKGKDKVFYDNADVDNDDTLETSNQLIALKPRNSALKIGRRDQLRSHDDFDYGSFDEYERNKETIKGITELVSERDKLVHEALTKAVSKKVEQETKIEELDVKLRESVKKEEEKKREVVENLKKMKAKMAEIEEMEREMAELLLLQQEAEEEERLLAEQRRIIVAANMETQDTVVAIETEPEQFYRLLLLLNALTQEVLSNDTEMTRVSVTGSIPRPSIYSDFERTEHLNGLAEVTPNTAVDINHAEKITSTTTSVNPVPMATTTTLVDSVQIAAATTPVNPAPTATTYKASHDPIAPTTGTTKRPKVRWAWGVCGKHEEDVLLESRENHRHQREIEKHVESQPQHPTRNVLMEFFKSFSKPFKPMKENRVGNFSGIKQKDAGGRVLEKFDVGTGGQEEHVGIEREDSKKKLGVKRLKGFKWWWKRDQM